MTNSEALAMIKAIAPGEDSDEKNVLARASLNAAIAYVNLLGEFNWNKQYVSMTLTSGNGSWNVADLIPDHIVRKIFDEELWFTGRTGKIEIVDRQVFNSRARGHTSTGVPQIACVHSKDMVLEVYPTPNSDYEVWGMVGVLASNISDLPEEIQLPIIHLAIISMIPANSPAYRASSNIWAMAESKLANLKSYTSWDGSEMKPDPFAPGMEGGGLGGVDSNNPLGEL